MKEKGEDIKREVDLANSVFGKKPPVGLKSKILDILDNLKMEENFDLQNPPLINAYSDYLQWQKAIQNIQTSEEYENIYLYPILENDKINMFVAWAKIGVPDEVHEEMQESFLLLEGTCRCQIGENFYDFREGDFIEIPLHIQHNLQVTSNKPVKVILQRIFV